ncbi:MAG: efflux RND transporter periplasmic adaptor subunit [bacterium]
MLQIKSPRLILVGFYLMMAVSQFTCGNDGRSNQGSNGLEEVGDQAVPVETYTIRAAEVVDKIRATGTIFPLHDVLVSSETAGTITQVYAEVGDLVKKGDVLVQVDEELKQLALQQAAAKLVEAKAAYEKAEKDYERNKQLFENQDISEYIFENARLQKESAYAAYLMAQANKKMAERHLKDARILSPVEGYVAARLVELGSTVAPGTPVAKVVDISLVKVKLGVSEKDIVKISKGQPATIFVDSYPSEEFQGHVAAVGPQAELSTRSFPVEILVENSDFRLKAGMLAKVEVATQIRQNVPLLPKSALLERSGQTLIFVIKNGRAQKRIPKLGLESGDKIVLLAGAKAGEEVVILGQENLVHGVQVEVQKKH